MNLKKEQEELLKKYNINLSDYSNIQELLMAIDDEMTDYLDENDEPLPEFLELQKLYDEIYGQKY